MLGIFSKYVFTVCLYLLLPLGNKSNLNNSPGGTKFVSDSDSSFSIILWSSQIMIIYEALKPDWSCEFPWFITIWLFLLDLTS